MSITSVDRANELTAELLQQAADIVAAKRPVYTQKHPDVLHNFKLNAQMANSSIGQAIAFGLAKQFLSVQVLLTDPTVNDSEAATRFADVINYTILAYMAWKEGRAYGQD